MSFGLSAGLTATTKEQQEKQAREKEKKDTYAVSSLLVNSGLPAEKIAEIT